MSTPGAPALSIVVIGRNEGQRLARCLAAVERALAAPALADTFPSRGGAAGMRFELIYVDSASTDASTAVAARAGAEVVRIGPDGLSAAAARNAGWRHARGEWILFLDGDTELEAAFLPAAAPLLARVDVAAVYGYRFEKHPERSLYHRLLEVEWLRQAGPAAYFGGDVLVRRRALAEVGGFDATLKAGEEPELSRRLTAGGWWILALDVPMTAHDLAMTRFSQYWRRARRTGQAYAEVSARFASTEDPFWRREARHNLRQTALWALLGLAALAGAVLAEPLLAAAALLTGAGLCLRSAWRARRRFASPFTALAYGVHAQFQHLPICVGQLEVRLRGQGATMNYKESVQ